MYYQMTFWDTTSATFSPESADGAWRSVSSAGRTSAASGAVHAHVNLSARQAKAMGLLTSGTCGPRSTGLSASVGRQSSLASRLAANVSCRGSILYRMTWKRLVTPSGRVIFRLQASARRLSGSGFIGADWPTPAGTDGKGGYAGGRLRRGKLSTDRLDVTAQLAGWPTPTANNGTGPHPDLFTKDFPNLQTTAQLAGWATPTATDAARGRGTKRPWDTGTPLPQQAASIGPARLTATGQILTGSCAETKNGDLLNPDLSLWLMGLPNELRYCALSATP